MSWRWYTIALRTLGSPDKFPGLMLAEASRLNQRPPNPHPSRQPRLCPPPTMTMIQLLQNIVKQAGLLRMENTTSFDISGILLLTYVANVPSTISNALARPIPTCHSLFVLSSPYSQHRLVLSVSSHRPGSSLVLNVRPSYLVLLPN